MTQKKVFIASTGKDVGKTTFSLGLIDYLNRHCGPCGFMKPVGQDQLLHEGTSLDKDAVLVKHFFKLKELQDLSPLSIPQGFTKDFLDHKISKESLVNKLKEANQNLNHYKSIVYEGTGHLGVGSIINLSNAHVAKLLNTPIVLVTKGGIGSSFDELMLNISLCKEFDLKIIGVVLNKVLTEKKDTTSYYFEKALKPLNIPFLGSLPFDLLLSQPTFNDLEQVLDQPILQGHELCLKHIQNTLIVASNNQVPDLKAYDLVIVSTSREGLIHALIQQAASSQIPIGFVLTGTEAPSEWTLSELQKTLHFVLFTPKNSQEVLIDLSQFHAKIQFKDQTKIHEAIKLVQKHIDLKQLLSLI